MVEYNDTTFALAVEKALKEAFNVDIWLFPEEDYLRCQKLFYQGYTVQEATEFFIEEYDV